MLIFTILKEVWYKDTILNIFLISWFSSSMKIYIAVISAESIRKFVCKTLGLV